VKFLSLEPLADLDLAGIDLAICPRKRLLDSIIVLLSCFRRTKSATKQTLEADGRIETLNHRHRAATGIVYAAQTDLGLRTPTIPFGHL
jgi:hypothetical protein